MLEAPLTARLGEEGRAKEPMAFVHVEGLASAGCELGAGLR